MFLFTTPTPATTTTGRDAVAGSAPVVDAIRRGADQSGVSFDYLLNTARRESAMEPAARAPNSSATGLFQFIEQTWLGLVKSDGERLGLGRYAEAVIPRAGGGFTVADEGTRQAILKLREDPEVASAMAGVLTRQNRDALASTTGREPTGTDLYAAHLLGARGAGDLIRTADATPSRAAAIDMPEAAASNRPIFYDKAGRPRGAAEVYALLGQGSGATAGSPVVTGSAETLSEAAGTPNGPALYALFRTGSRSGPISDSVARIWRVNNAPVSAAPRERTGPTFFPRSDGSTGTDRPEVSAEPDVPAPAVVAAVPLPPARPAALSGGRRP